jgi:hypothetical protein
MAMRGRLIDDLGTMFGIALDKVFQGFYFFGVDLRQSDVGDHDGSDTLIDRFAKRGELGLFQTLARIVDYRQAAVRVDRRIAMAGKMFCRRYHALALDALCERDPESRDVRGILAKAPDVDHRVRGVVVYIEHRRVDVVDTDRTRFAAGDDTHAACVIRIAGRCNGHRPWKVRSVLDPHPDPGLGVKRHKQRYGRCFLHTVREMRRLVYRCSEKNDPADLVFGDVAPQVFEKRALLIGEPGVDTDMYELADLFIDRHFL